MTEGWAVLFKNVVLHQLEVKGSQNAMLRIVLICFKIIILFIFFATVVVSMRIQSPHYSSWDVGSVRL